MTWNRLAAVSFAALTVAACGGNDNGPDHRCADVAQVPGWGVGFTVAFSDTGTARDTFRIRLHHAVDGTGSTGPSFPTTGFDGLAWFTITPTGTIGVHDTVINTALGDTLASVVTSFSTHPSWEGQFSGGYVSVDLDQCTADVGARFYGPAVVTIDGAAQPADTVLVGYSLIKGLPVDSLHVANGWTVPAVKVATRAGAYDFVHDSQYLALSVSGKYAPGKNADSATISFAVSPMAALTARRP